MPRRKRTRESSEASHAVETLAAGGHVLQSHTKQTTLSFPIMSGNKKIPATMSQSTPSKTDVQQLLAKISPLVIHNALRSFREQQPTTTLLVTNLSSPIISLSRIPVPEQGTVKLLSSLPHGVISGITAPSQVSGGQELEDSDVIIVGSTPGYDHPPLSEIPVPQHAKGSRLLQIAPHNIF